jgi:hypothetical protein
MTKTSNFSFDLIDFDKRPWHDDEHNNWHLLDALLARYVSISNVQGVWEQALSVTAGQKYIDPDEDSIWEALISHTTASSGLFAADRTNNSSYWQTVSVDVVSKGEWATDTVYSLNEFVYSGNIYAVCTTAHTSGATFAGDSANWGYLIDTTASIAAAALSASNAAASETAAAASAAGVNLPSIVASEFLQANAGATAYESKSAAEMLTALGAITISSTDSLTNKTIDADGTGNVISNIDLVMLLQHHRQKQKLVLTIQS